MNNKDAGIIVSKMWNDILIANWFDKEWIEQEFGVSLSEWNYREIVRLYNESNMSDKITEEIRDWFIDNEILEKKLEYNVNYKKGLNKHE